MRRLELAGKTFGRLLAKEVVGINKSKQRLWKCLCECGREHVVSQAHLTKGKTKS